MTDPALLSPYIFNGPPVRDRTSIRPTHWPDRSVTYQQLYSVQQLPHVILGTELSGHCVRQLVTNILHHSLTSIPRKEMPHKVVYSQPFEQIEWPKYTMNILAAHLNTSRATEVYLTILELADIGGQNVVYHINLSSLVLL